MSSLKVPLSKLPGLCLYYDFLPVAAHGHSFQFVLTKSFFKNCEGSAFPCLLFLTEFLKKPTDLVPFQKRFKPPIILERTIVYKRNRNDVFSQITFVQYSGISIKRTHSFQKMCPLYGGARFIECFPKTQLFSKI